MKVRLRPIPTLLLFCSLLPHPAGAAQHPALTLAEIVQESDLVFIGTVEQLSPRANEQRTTILTDVRFGAVETIRASVRARQAGRSTIVLTRAGGELGGRSSFVSDQAPLRPGARYLVCAFDHGTVPLDFVLGGPKGIFELPSRDGVDAGTVLDAAGQTVTAVEATGARVQRSRETRSASGRFAAGMLLHRLDVLPPPLGNEPTTTVKPSQAGTSAGPESPPISVDDFVARIRELETAPVAQRVLDPARRGSLLLRDDSGVLRSLPFDAVTPGPHGIPPGKVPPFIGAGSGSHGGDAPTGSGPPEGIKGSCEGNILTNCGFFNLPIAMQMLPREWWSYIWHDDGMVSINLFANVFRTIPSDGFYGDDNGENEFCGWVSDGELLRVYGTEWGTAVAATLGDNGSACDRISEADIAYNPAFTWVATREEARLSFTALQLMPILMHELGHVTGLQRTGVQDEYFFDVPTIMHGADNFVEEDGRGIHAADARLIRSNYSGRASLPAVQDLGVESYSACAGLVNATTNDFVFNWGESLRLTGITAENMSTGVTVGVGLAFYLSRDRDYDSNDIRLGSASWVYALPFAAGTADYSFPIPEGTPGGDYFVIARISAADGRDDFPFNDVASLPSPITIFTPPPSITTVSPTYVEPTGTKTVTIRGEGFASEGTNVFVSPAVTSQTVRIDSPTSIALILRGLETTPLGARAIRIFNTAPGGGFAVRDAAFTLAIIVHPGDADSNGRVEARDILPIGRDFGKRGAARPGASLAWEPQYLLTRWTSGGDPHADCDGDGVVGERDVQAILENWGARVGSPSPEVVDRANIERQLLTAIDAMPDGDVKTRIRAAILGHEDELFDGGGDWIARIIPNPFRASTVLEFHLPGAAAASRVDVYDVRGQHVWGCALDQVATLGRADWNGRSSVGSAVPPGLYFARFTSGSFSTSRRLLRLP